MLPFDEEFQEQVCWLKQGILIPFLWLAIVNSFTYLSVRQGQFLAFPQVLGFVNAVAFSEQNVETELEARLERVRHGLGLEGPNTWGRAGDCFLLVSHTFENFFLNGYNVFYHKGILKMEQKLGGVAIPESKPFTS